MARLRPPSSASRDVVAIVGHVLTPVLLGTLLYLGWREPGLRVFRWADAAGLGGAVEGLRAAVDRGPTLPAWVAWCVPDGLWVYAFTACLGRLWGGTPEPSARLWLGLPLLLGGGAELLQAAHLLPGVFDPRDLAANVLGAALALLTLPRSRP